MVFSCGKWGRPSPGGWLEAVDAADAMDEVPAKLIFCTLQREEGTEIALPDLAAGQEVLDLGYGDHVALLLGGLVGDCGFVQAALVAIDRDHSENRIFSPAVGVASVDQMTNGLAIVDVAAKRPEVLDVCCVEGCIQSLWYMAISCGVVGTGNIILF